MSVRSIVGYVAGKAVVISKNGDSLVELDGTHHQLRGSDLRCKYGSRLTSVLTRAVKRAPYMRHIDSCDACRVDHSPTAAGMTLWHSAEQARWVRAGAETEVVDPTRWPRNRPDLVFREAVTEVQHSYLSEGSARARSKAYGESMIWIYKVPDRVKRVPSQTSLWMLDYGRRTVPIAIQACGGAIFASHQGVYYRVVGVLRSSLYVIESDPLTWAVSGRPGYDLDLSDASVRLAASMLAERPRRAGLSEAVYKQLLEDAHERARAVASSLQGDGVVTL